MPQNDERPEGDNETTDDRSRRRHEVVKTTIEIDKELYIRMKEEVARSSSSIREFVSKAAIERLIRNEPDAPSNPKIEENKLLDNPFAIKVLAVLEHEVPNPFSVVLLISKLKKAGIERDVFSAAYLSDAFIRELVRPVDFLSGPDAALAMKNALLHLRRE